MPKYTVHIPERHFPLRRMMTEQQFLAEYRVRDKGDSLSKSGVWNLREAVSVWLADTDGQPIRRVICRKVHQLFAVIGSKATVRDIIVRIRWKSGEIGPHGLFALNCARRQPAFRKDGYNIVSQLGPAGPRMRDDFMAVLSALEIRPLFRGETPKGASPAPATALRSPLTVYITSNVTKDVTSTVKAKRNAKKRSHARK